MSPAPSSQDAQGLHTFLKDAVPSHKLSDSQAAVAALDQPHLDWGELDSIFTSVLDNFDGALAQQLISQLGRLVQQAELPSLAAGLFAYAGHLVDRLSKEGANPVSCKRMVLQMLGNVAHLHTVPSCPAAAEVSVAAVNLGTALARDVVLHHAGTRSAAIITAFITQLESAIKAARQAMDEEEEVPEGMVPWAAAVMSCTYLLALQFKDASCPKTREAVWERLVPQAFVLTTLCSRCTKLPNRAEWQSLVQPAVLLASAPRLLVGQLRLQQTETQALQPLNAAEVMHGLVPLLELLSRSCYEVAQPQSGAAKMSMWAGKLEEQIGDSRAHYAEVQGSVCVLWYHPHGDNREEDKSGGNSSCGTTGSREGNGGSKVAAGVAGSSGSSNAGRSASASTAAEGGGSGSGSGAGEGSGSAAAGVDSSSGNDADVSEGSSRAAADKGSGSRGDNMGPEDGSEGQGKAGGEDGPGSTATAAPQEASPAVAEQVPKQQVGRALSGTLASLQLLLRSGVGVKYYVQAGGVVMGVDHVHGYAQYLGEWKQRQQEEQQAQQQQQQQQQEAVPAVAASGGGSGGAGQQVQGSRGWGRLQAGGSAADAGATGGPADLRSVAGEGEGESEEAGKEGGAFVAWASLQGPPGNDPAHQILVTLIDCMCLAMTGDSMQEAQGVFVERAGYQHTLACLDETPCMAELVKQAEEGRPQAWAAKRALLRLIEAVLVGRDVCKEDFHHKTEGFFSVWQCMSLLSLSRETEERLQNASPGIVRGVLGNALSVLSGYAARNYEDEAKQAEERCKQLVEWLEDVTTLPELLALLKWQPQGYDSVQAALQGESSGILSLHAALLTVAWRWLSSSPRQLELLAHDPSLRAPFLEALRLPGEHFRQNQQAISSALLALALLVRAHPECVPELLEEGIMQDLLQLLLHCFQSGAQEEVKLQDSLRAVRTRGAFNPLSREQERTAMRIYSLAVAPFQIAMSHVTGLLHLMPLQDGCHGPSVLKSLAKHQLLLEQLTRLLRKSGKFTDAPLQTNARYMLHWLKLVELAKAASGSAEGDVTAGMAEDASTQAAAELLRAEHEAKQRELAKLERKRRQKEKQREREEREWQEREERERAERERQAREEEEERQRQEAELAEPQQAAAGSGQQGKAAKKKKKKQAEEAAAVASQQPASSSSKGEPVFTAATPQQPASSSDSSIHAISPRVAVTEPATPTIVHRIANSNPGYRSPGDTTTGVNQSSGSGSSRDHGDIGRGCRAAEGSSSEGSSSSSGAVPSLAAPSQRAEPSSWAGLPVPACQWESSQAAGALEEPSAPQHCASSSAAPPMDEQELEFEALFSQLLPGLSLLSSGPSSSPGPGPSSSRGAAAGGSDASPAPSAVVLAAREGAEGQGHRGSQVQDPALAAMLRCALSGQQLRDPVVAADGWTYEREMITAWLAAGLTQSPVTGQPLGSTVLHPNYLVRQLLEELA